MVYLAEVIAPKPLSTTMSVAYELPWVASCTDYYGDYLRLSFPYLVTKAAPSLSCVRNSDSDPELDCSLVSVLHDMSLQRPFG